MSAEAVSASVAALAFIINAWSMFYLARQTKVSNAVAAASANDAVLRSLREVHVLMLERQVTRDYFYGGRQLPDTGEERETVLTLGELLNDVMSSGVRVHAQIPDSGSSGPWAEFCRHTVENSPVVRRLLQAHPTWWPSLMGVLPDNFSEAGALGVPVPRNDQRGS
ncbi:hypothetical protein [Streptomyces sp. NPDC056600]|uniref:hypothetical protein n=1 Tax=Streptomyces sp. NPDC056600 TaxID=3345874 RepID=UPI0036B12E9F